jgi:hypothetical protein
MTSQHRSDETHACEHVAVNGVVQVVGHREGDQQVADPIHLTLASEVKKDQQPDEHGDEVEDVLHDEPPSNTTGSARRSERIHSRSCIRPRVYSNIRYRRHQ